MSLIFVIGPCWNNLNTLLKTIEINRSLINNIKHFYIPTNDKTVENYFTNLKDENITCNFFHENQGHQLSCYNSVIAGMNMIIRNDLSYNDTDIVIFCHEDCYIEDMNLFNKAKKKILDDNYELVCRKFNAIYYKNFFENYYMCDTFLIKRNIINKVFESQNILEYFFDIIKDDDNKINRNIYHRKNRKFCEAHFTNIIEKYRVYSILYTHATCGDTELGVHHIPSRNIEYDLYWDKSNINNLY